MPEKELSPKLKFRFEKPTIFFPSYSEPKALEPKSYKGGPLTTSYMVGAVDENGIECVVFLTEFLYSHFVNQDMKDTEVRITKHENEEDPKKVDWEVYLDGERMHPQNIPEKTAEPPTDLRPASPDRGPKKTLVTPGQIHRMARLYMGCYARLEAEKLNIIESLPDDQAKGELGKKLRAFEIPHQWPTTMVIRFSDQGYEGAEDPTTEKQSDGDLPQPKVEDPPDIDSPLGKNRQAVIKILSHVCAGDEHVMKANLMSFMLKAGLTGAIAKHADLFRLDEEQVAKVLLHANAEYKEYKALLDGLSDKLADLGARNVEDEARLVGEYLHRCKTQEDDTARKLDSIGYGSLRTIRKTVVDDHAKLKGAKNGAKKSTT